VISRDRSTKHSLTWEKEFFVCGSITGHYGFEAIFLPSESPLPTIRPQPSMCCGTASDEFLDASMGEPHGDEEQTDESTQIQWPLAQR
jgi:hypothetical protein